MDKLTNEVLRKTCIEFSGKADIYNALNVVEEDWMRYCQYLQDLGHEKAEAYEDEFEDHFSNFISSI